MITEETLKLAATVDACQAALKKAAGDKEAAYRAELDRRESALREIEKHDDVIHRAQGALSRAAAARNAIRAEVDPETLGAVDKAELAVRMHADRLKVAKGRVRDEMADYQRHEANASLEDKKTQQKKIDEMDLVVAELEEEGEKLEAKVIAAKKSVLAAIDRVKKGIKA